MKIWVYALCRNEAKMIGYMLRHYQTFADKIIIYDEHSDDGTREIIAQCPLAECRDYQGEQGIADDTFRVFFNQQWKEARGQADWVMWVDVDEMMYHPDMRNLLEQYQQDGVQVPRVQGYVMVSETFPQTPGQITDEIKTGFISGEWTKHQVFNPAIDMRWGVGRHNIETPNPQFSPQVDIKLLHYRYLGEEYTRWRTLRNNAHQPPRCFQQGFGVNNAPNSTMHYSLYWYLTEIKGKTFPNVI